MARGDTLLSPSKSGAINAMRSTNRGGGSKGNAGKVASAMSKGGAPRANFVQKSGKGAGKMRGVSARGKSGGGGG